MTFGNYLRLRTRFGHRSEAVRLVELGLKAKGR
jgi:hypothetical protein